MYIYQQLIELVIFSDAPYCDVTKTVTLRPGDMIWRYGVRSCRKKERQRIRPVCSRNTTSQERKPCSESVHHTVRRAKRTLRFRLVTLITRLRCSVFILPHGMTVTGTDYTHMPGIGRTFTG
jgi:hypothetical protein